MVLDNLVGRQVRSIGGRVPIFGHDRPEAMSQRAPNRRINAELGRKPRDDDLVNASGGQLAGKRRVQEGVARFLCDAHVAVFDHQVLMQGMPRL